MPKNLKRYYDRHHPHFLSCTCYRRMSLLGSASSRNVFAKIHSEVRDGYGFLLVGYVAMPNHIHLHLSAAGPQRIAPRRQRQLLLSEPAKGTPSTVMQVLKQRVSRKLRGKKRRSAGAQLSLPFGGNEDAPGQFWQRRFHDFNVWSYRKRKQKLEYMHMNPVKRKLACDPKDWVWSSYLHYAKGEKGLVRIDEVN